MPLKTTLIYNNDNAEDELLLIACTVIDARYDVDLRFAHLFYKRLHGLLKYSTSTL